MIPRLSDLHPAWICPPKDGIGFVELSTGHRPHVLWGLHMLCPICFMRNGGPVGTHAIHCLTLDAPADMPPLPGRWAVMGETLTRLTLSPSVDLPNGCKAHFWVRDGQIKLVV